MNRGINIPDDPPARFRAIYDALNEQRGWWGDATSLRFAAVSALTCRGEPASVADSIRIVAEEIKAASGWFGPLNSNLRFVVAAMLVAHDDTPHDFLAEVKRVRKLLRDAGVRRLESYETITILVLRIKAGRAPIDADAIRRCRDIYHEMKQHHWWLTGPEDFPVCAMLSDAAASAQQIGHDIEGIYQALRSRKFSWGDALQTAANILYLARLGPEETADRYEALSVGFQSAGVSIRKSDYDELAILTFLHQPPERVVETVLRHREVMRSLRPKPNGSMTFNLAASTTFLELIRLDENMKVLADAKALLDMQEIIRAEQAASVAAVVAASS